MSKSLKENFKYIPKEDRNKVLILCDDIRMHSGIATMAREIVVGTAQHFNWYNLGAGINHPDTGKILDLSQSTNNMTGLQDSSVYVQPNNGYGDAGMLRKLIKEIKPDAIMIFTDPRYWVWLFDLEREIRKEIPICYLNIWDDFPAPLYNEPYYEACDLLMSISKQTKLVNELVLGEKAKDKVLKYVPHGINENIFKPIEDKKQVKDFLSNISGWKDYKFVVFFNSRNIRRKNPGDVILAYRQFCDMVGKDVAKDCALLMHTAPVDQNGTDLNAVREALCDPEYVNVHFSTNKLLPEQMNMLYNVADVTMLISSNEGWGLSLTESMMAGTMIIANVTGGMQDQMRFENKKGEWVDLSADFPSNHRGTIKKHGEWALPVYPSNISLVGSVPTPYIFDDRCSTDDVAKAIKEAFDLSPEERDRRGTKGREWVTSKESGMSSKYMCQNVIEAIDTTLENFTPRRRYDLTLVEDSKPKYVEHRLFDYKYKD